MSLSPAETEAIRALGQDFAPVWNDPACPMVLKMQIARNLINEIVVNLDEAAQTLQMIIHWRGGCHTFLTMTKPQSGSVAHKTALEDIESITRMAHRYRDDEIARVLTSSDGEPVKASDGAKRAWPMYASSIGLIRSMKQYVNMELSRSGGDVEILLFSSGFTDPLVSYPPPCEVKTAGEWNSIAIHNQRVSVSIDANQ